MSTQILELVSFYEDDSENLQYHVWNKTVNACTSHTYNAVWSDSQSVSSSLLNSSFIMSNILKPELVFLFHKLHIHLYILTDHYMVIHPQQYFVQHP
jgi:hypothetical protein